MQKLFVENINDEKIILDGESARHIAKSLRMKVGDVICVTDGGGDDYGCQIEEVTKDEVVLKVCYKQACESEPSCRVTIYQGVPKSSKNGRYYSKMRGTRCVQNCAYPYKALRFPPR